MNCEGGVKRLLLAIVLCIPAEAFAQPAAQGSTPSSCDHLFTTDEARARAEKWINSWNAHNADGVMALYTPDFEFRAHGVLSSPRISHPSGILRGHADNRLRWFGDGDDSQSTRRFGWIGHFTGVRSAAVHYNGPNSRVVAEVSEYAPNCLIERSSALYQPHVPVAYKPARPQDLPIPPSRGRCDFVVASPLANELADAWIAAWNAHDATAIKPLYTPDFVMQAPDIVTDRRHGNPDGVLKGWQVNRAHWFVADRVRRDYRLIGTFSTVRSIAIHYEAKGSGVEYLEVLELTPDCKIERANRLYRPVA